MQHVQNHQTEMMLNQQQQIAALQATLDAVVQGLANLNVSAGKGLLKGVKGKG
eukprot:gene6154-6024_t